MYSAIDIGSNSIRLGIYKFEGNELNLVFKEKTTIGLAAYIEDGILSQEGIEKTCEVLLEYKDIIKRFSNENIYAFATASLRKAENKEQAVKYIKKVTGIDVEVISGEQEGNFDFTGTIRSLKMKEGVLVDIGGGSTEVVIFRNKSVSRIFSMPIGSLDFYSKYVGLLFPNKEEITIMENKVLEELQKIDDINGEYFKDICGVGGSIKGSMLINESIYGNQKNTKDEMECKNVKILIEELSKMNKSNINKILKVVPSKIHTIIPGMIILNTIIDFFKSEKIYLSKSGVREGYLYSKIKI